MEKKCLPMSRAEMQQRGWEQVDYICVTGDAYVDHPSFGIAIVARVLEQEGFRVGIVAQPKAGDPNAMTVLGRPRYGFFVTGGNVDSMVCNYTAAKRRRSDDPYSPGGRAGRRPDRATLVYCRMIRQAYGPIPLIIGGLEASLRRFAHYDYWADAVLPSILYDSGADLLVYGMGEKQTAALAHRLAAGDDPATIHDLRGTCYLERNGVLPVNSVSCASYEKVATDKETYARAFKQQMDEQDALVGRPVVQKHGDVFLVQNPPMPPLQTDELDRVFAMPFTKKPHPVYDAQGGVEAIAEVQFSIMHNRGCFGHCNFCSIAFHQGRRVTSRSHESVLREVREMTKMEGFKGYVHDVGGPTANFRGPSCAKQKDAGMCKGRKCLAPKPCSQLIVDHRDYLSLLRKIRAVPGVKKVFIRSGIRFDYLMADPDETFFKELVEYHVSGQLKVAPEHCAAGVLERMGKPPIEVYNRFSKRFYELTESIGKKQYLVPYLMSSHPGSTMKEAIELAVFLKRHRMRPEQVQDFYPTPGTASTCMFYTGLDPYTMKPVYVPRTQQEKVEQRALLQYYKPENRAIIERALRQAGRTDLIGSGKDCLIPRAPYTAKTAKNSHPRTSACTGRRAVDRQKGVSKSFSHPDGRRKTTNGKRLSKPAKQKG